jgi:hypothetical protein
LLIGELHCRSGAAFAGRLLDRAVYLGNAAVEVGDDTRVICASMSAGLGPPPPSRHPRRQGDKR